MNIPHIKNAFEHIQIECNQNLLELYPHGVPALVQNRYEKELTYLETSEYLDDFEIYRLLSNEAKKCCLYFTLRGNITGSFLIYLLGFGRFNPLPAHYYCPHCGYFETVATHLLGIDLPEITCPNCGHTLPGDGYGLFTESVWGTDGKKLMSFEYGICEEFRPFAKKILTALYPENPVVIHGVPITHGKGKYFDPHNVDILHGGFLVLPSGQSTEDYPDLQSYLENGEPCLTGYFHQVENHGMKRILLLPAPRLEHLITLQRKTGIYVHEINIPELRNLTHYDFINSRTLELEDEDFFSYEKPKNHSKMITYRLLVNNSYFDIDYDTNDKYDSIKKIILDTPEFKKYPCAAREDFFDYLVETGSSVNEAFRISELIRKGRSRNDPDFAIMPIPEEIKKLAYQYAYIFPKAHAIEYHLLSARLAYYMKQDSKLYSKIVFEKKK